MQSVDALHGEGIGQNPVGRIIFPRLLYAETARVEGVGYNGRLPYRHPQRVALLLKAECRRIESGQGSLRLKHELAVRIERRIEQSQLQQGCRRGQCVGLSLPLILLGICLALVLPRTVSRKTQCVRAHGVAAQGVRESELTAGYHTEYSGIHFGFFYLAEYLNLFIVAGVASLLFFGGWMPLHIPGWDSFNHIMDYIPSVVWFIGKAIALSFIIIWFKWTFPRLRIDQLLSLEWKYLLPINLFNLALMVCIIVFGWHF